MCSILHHNKKHTKTINFITFLIFIVAFNFYSHKLWLKTTKHLTWKISLSSSRWWRNVALHPHQVITQRVICYPKISHRFTSVIVRGAWRPRTTWFIIIRKPLLILGRVFALMHEIRVGWTLVDNRFIINHYCCKLHVSLLWILHVCLF